MKLDEVIERCEEKLHNEEFPDEESRKEHLELLEWLIELRESRKVIRTVQEHLLNPNVCVLNNPRMCIDFD